MFKKTLYIYEKKREKQSTLQQIVKENSPHTNTQDTIYDIYTMSELTSVKRIRDLPLR